MNRHPHPHIDPRRPRDGSRIGTNPPVFAWKPVREEVTYRLTVAGDPGLKNPVFEQTGLRDPVFLPAARLAPGQYWWTWSDGENAGEVLRFSVDQQSIVLEVPEALTWIDRLPLSHPRIYFRPDTVDKFRANARGRTTSLEALLADADALLRESRHIDEPDRLPNREKDYAAFWKVWYPTMWSSRRFVKGAETLALAFQVTGNREYARAACERMADICRWDPHGASALDHNDEAHMSVIWHGPTACDWVWEELTDSERGIIIEQYAERGRITFHHMHDRGTYGVTRFDSHAGREIVFLAILAMVFHEHIPEATQWLEWLRPVLCGIWPVWAGDDGGWAEGPSYGQAYVTIMTMFASALKRGCGVDLYRRPFWNNHAIWRRECVPAYAEWLGFGDHSERWASGLLSNASLVELIGAETGDSACETYVQDLRREAALCSTPEERRMPGLLSQLFTAPLATSAGHEVPATHGQSTLRVYPAAGWASLRSAPSDPDHDIALIFRSSPFGSISHSHASNNDFVLHVAGRAMLMPSGYYSGYGSNHHAHWVWHTKAHNCITLSDSPQLLRSYGSTGAVEGGFEDDELCYFCGVADASYGHLAARCRRHVLFLKGPSALVLIDEVAALPGVSFSVQWNAHSWSPFEIDEEAKIFSLVRGSAAVRAHILHHAEGFFSSSHGWDPPPVRTKDSSQWHEQYHLRYTMARLCTEEPVRLGVVLCPAHPELSAAEVRCASTPDGETVHIAGWNLLIHPRGKSIVTLRSSLGSYEVSDPGPGGRMRRGDHTS